MMARARQAGVTRMLTIGTEVPTSRAAIALAEAEPDVWATVGVHPHDAADADAGVLTEIERLAGGPRVVAVGEIGLDFFRDLSPRDVQERVFRHLIGLARRVRKPVVVHCRDAHAEVLAILGEGGASEVGGIMHCFSGDVEIARRCLDLGLLVSLAGPVTYPNARALPDVARFVPADRLVIETEDRKSTRLNSSHTVISYAVFCLKKKKTKYSAHSYPRPSRYDGVFQIAYLSSA